MKVRILRSALEGLASGRRFYDRQGKAVGDYFFDSLFSDIGSLSLYGGIHRTCYGFHRSLARRFPYAIYYRIIPNEVVCSGFSIAVENQSRFGRRSSTNRDWP